MKIVCLKGGLGNQMFEYCRYRMLLDKHEEKVYLYRDPRRLRDHGRLSLEQAFMVILPKTPLFVHLTVAMLKLLRSLHLFPRLYDDLRDDCVLIDDYCQNLNFITHARSLLQFREHAFSEETRKLMSRMEDEPYAVAVHVRRGDYLHPDNLPHFGVCSEQYYEEALSLVREKHPEATFYFFSDDMDWVREHLLVEGATYVEQPGSPDYEDLWLMTRCKGHVIANSTFSFWGAYLSVAADGMTVYPNRWFRDEQWTKPPIFPSDWYSI